jgi:hypothetical protein
VATPTFTKAQTPDDISQLISRLVELDSIDLAKGIKFRAGLEPALSDLESDESSMKVLENPYEVHGQGKPAAAGWYRTSFVVPEQIGKFKFKQYNLGIESNVLGSWEMYTYINGKHAGLWSKEGMQKATDRPPTDWMSNAPMPAKPGDQITIAILAMASPLGRGSPDGFGLRHLRLRFALGHTAARRPFYGDAPAPGQGTGLHGVREKLRTLQGDELSALQAKLKEPLANIDAVFAAGDTETLDNLTKAMAASAKEINEALKK